jgi:chromosome partitioning protein
MKATIGNLKGGVAKSTTTVYLALALARQGRRVLIVDEDTTNKTCLKWKALAPDWPGSVTVLAFGDDLVRSIQAIAGDFDDILIDTSPHDDLLLRKALMITDELLIPVAPSPMELEQLPDTFALAAEIDAVSPVYPQVLLVKIRAGTRSSRLARAWLTDHNLKVMAAEVHNLERYPLGYGTVPADLGEYAGVLEELASDAAAA